MQTRILPAGRARNHGLVLEIVTAAGMGTHLVTADVFSRARVVGDFAKNTRSTSTTCT